MRGSSTDAKFARVAPEAEYVFTSKLNTPVDTSVASLESKQRVVMFGEGPFDILLTLFFSFLFAVCSNCSTSLFLMG